MNSYKPGCLLTIEDRLPTIQDRQGYRRFAAPHSRAGRPSRAHIQGKPSVRNIFNVGLEEWQPLEGVEYDLIWRQWCLGHLTDEQVVQYLELCKTVLRLNSGIIVINTSGIDLFDHTDSSVTRQDETFQSLFKKAGLKVVRTELQRGFPESSPRKLFPVRMYALKP
ncbi:Alpha N-terminal protein methyltransferase 1 [Tolypocladium ophioglossoides CBS 100239]|uniref:Alpha N-terminal protein methyltransferase 1 n=1 Tax=Tolypocladium ophioglossoides (strain CBS 100239) TaxID=1163406 RepID=A0A0L0MW68_TOLOC|nr:Alpha N-terminal protein methyltransferase 1 [Tolypocladium ophioglossoides CBS 100239]